MEAGVGGDGGDLDARGMKSKIELGIVDQESKHSMTWVEERESHRADEEHNGGVLGTWDTIGGEEDEFGP